MGSTSKPNWFKAELLELARQGAPRPTGKLGNPPINRINGEEMITAMKILASVEVTAQDICAYLGEREQEYILLLPSNAKIHRVEIDPAESAAINP